MAKKTQNPKKRSSLKDKLQESYTSGFEDGRKTGRIRGWTLAKLDTFRSVARACIKSKEPFAINHECAKSVLHLVERELDKEGV